MAIITAMNSVVTLTDLVKGMECFCSQVKQIYSQISNLTVLHVRSKISDSVWSNMQYRSRLDSNGKLNLNVFDSELDQVSFNDFLDFLKHLTNDFKSGGGRGLDDQLVQFNISLEPSEMQIKAGDLALHLNQLKRLGGQSKTIDAEEHICTMIIRKLKDFANNAGGKQNLLLYAKSFQITFQKVLPLQEDQKPNVQAFDTLWKQRNQMATQPSPTKVDDLIHRLLTAIEYGRMYIVEVKNIFGIDISKIVNEKNDSNYHQLIGGKIVKRPTPIIL